MTNLFTILLLLSLLGLLVGVLKPALLKLKSKMQSLYIFGGLFVVLLIVFSFISAPTPQVKNTENKQVSKPITLEDKVANAINDSIGSKTNMGKQRVVSVEVDKYNDKMISLYKYKPTDSVVELLIEINSDENLTPNLQKGTMNNEATKITQAVFPLDKTIGDIIIWSRLPVKDQYGNIKDDTAIVYSMSRSLFSKVNWSNFSHNDLPTLLNSEKNMDDRNNYFEKIKFD